MLDRLSVLPCYAIEPDLWNALESIKAAITVGLPFPGVRSRADSKQEDNARTTIMVIDSVTPLLKDHLMGGGAQGEPVCRKLLGRVDSRWQDTRQ